MLSRLRALFRRGAVESEMDEELRYHLEREAERLVAAGMPTHDARLMARRAFGNPSYIREEMRDARGWTWLEQLGQDLRYGTRALLRTPTFTAVAVLSLALGIGTNTAIFGLLYNVMFQPLAVAHPEQLAVLTRPRDNDTDRWFTDEQFRVLRDVPGPAGMTAWRDQDNVPIAVGESREAVNVHLVDGAYFSTLGLTPYRGRLIAAGDVAAATPVAVVSSRLAVRSFGAVDSAPGRTLVIAGQAFTVVGVAPPSFRGLDYPGYFEIAVPGTLASALQPTGHDQASPTVTVVLRADRAAWPALTASLDASLQRCCAQEQPGHLRLEDMTLGISGGKDDIRKGFAPILYALMASAAVVLLIACANVGNLLLLRAAAREREIAVRLSLGSSRPRIVRQLLTESALLGLAGMALGTVLAAWTTGLLIRWLPDAAGQYLDIIRFRPTTPILAFLSLAGLASVLAFGLVPALRATRPDILASLKAGGHGTIGGRGGVLGRGMVAVQMALALVLVCSALLLVTTLRNLASQDIGVNTANVVGMDVETRGGPYEASGIVPLYPGILRRVQALPGVSVAGMATMAPLYGGRYHTVQVVRSDATPDPAPAQYSGVSTHYFAAAGVPLLAGRDFADGDASQAEPIAIISVSVAVRRFGRTDPIGQDIRVVDGDNPAQARRVIGVVGDVRLGGPRDQPTLSIYVPLTQLGRWPYVQLLVRSDGRSGDVTKSVVDDVNRGAPGVRVRHIATMREKLASWLMRELLVAGLASLFGALALALAAMGLYGVIAYNVARRTNEIGVRMALGARAADVVALVVRHSLALVAWGMALGAPLVYVAGRALGSLLYGVGAHDIIPIAVSVALLFTVALAATLLPAARAARIDPLLALRQD